MAAPCPQLYVYELPPAYRDLPTTHRNGTGNPLTLGNQQNSAKPHDATALWNSEQYSVASLLYERAMSYRCRTRDPSKADLFFVPAFKQRLAEKQTCAEPGSAFGHKALSQRLKVPLPNATRPADWNGWWTTLEARGGADHIILNARSGMSWERYPYCELTMGAPALGAATYLSMEQSPAAALANGSKWVYPEGYCGQVCVDAYRPQLLSESFYWSIPWTSYVHVDAEQRSPPPWASLHLRKRLVVAHFGLLHKPILPRPTLQLRERLIEQCRAAGSPEKCVHSLPHLNKPEATALLYWESTFCMQPGGDTISRKGILDALLLGCIPVLFHKGQAHQWPWHWGSWVDTATVLLNQTEVRNNRLNVIDALASIPEERVHALQESIRKNAHFLHYSAVDTSELPSALRYWNVQDDAFEVLLDGAWKVSRDAKLQQLGHHLQRTHGGSHVVNARRLRLAMAAGTEEAVVDT